LQLLTVRRRFLRVGLMVRRLGLAGDAEGGGLRRGSLPRRSSWVTAKSSCLTSWIRGRTEIRGNDWPASGTDVFSLGLDRFNSSISNRLTVGSSSAHGGTSFCSIVGVFLVIWKGLKRFSESLFGSAAEGLSFNPLVSAFWLAFDATVLCSFAATVLGSIALFLLLLWSLLCTWSSFVSLNWHWFWSAWALEASILDSQLCSLFLLMSLGGLVRLEPVSSLL